MNFGKKNCCGNCLQDVLNRENQANQPAKTDSAVEVYCCTSGKPAATRFFSNGSAQKTEKLFKVDLAQEWVRP